MKSIVTKVLAVSVAVAVAAFALAGAAGATHVSAVITVPEKSTVGQPTSIRAELSSPDGGALSGMPVTFLTDASFAGVEGEVVLGRAVTDENGVAEMTFEPRTASEHEIRIQYLVPGDSEPEVVSRTISVAEAGAQLHQSKAGVNIPGLNVWLLIVLVAGVWTVLLSVAFRVIAIAHAGSDAEPGAIGHASGTR